MDHFDGLLFDCDYHIEGTAELTLEAHTPGRPETTGRMLSVVAGEGYTPGEHGTVFLDHPILLAA